MNKHDVHEQNEAKVIEEELEEAISSSKPTQAETLLELAAEVKLFHTSDDKAYADVVKNGHRETWFVRSKKFKLWISREFLEETGKPPGREALTAALDQIEAEAIHNGPTLPVYVRIGGFEGKIYLDLCDDEWRVVEIDANGWRVIQNPPVRFRRAPGMLPLPVPVGGGKIDLLRSFLNVSEESDDDFVLTVAWLLAALRPDGPFWLLAIGGEQGSAKTFFCKLMRMLIDPNIADNRTLPRDELDLFIAASNGWVLAFDNVSGLPFWIADAMCRISTGGGFGKRQLYTDDEETLFRVKRPQILNGIEDSVTRPDLADRAIILTLEPIPDDERKLEKELEAEFVAARPMILGALLDAVAVGLAREGQVELEQLPRMADCAHWLAACEPAFWEEGTFAKAYDDNRASLVETVLEAMPLATAIKDFVATLDKTDEWTGTATDLLALLNGRQGDLTIRRDRRLWPSTAKGLSGSLRRLAKPMRQSYGMTIIFGRGHKDKSIFLKLPRGPKPSPEPSQENLDLGFPRAAWK
jgi:hypothetical protein